MMVKLKLDNETFKKSKIKNDIIYLIYNKKINNMKNFKEFLNEYYSEPTFSHELNYSFKVPILIYSTIYPEDLENIILGILKNKNIQNDEIDIYETNDSEIEKLAINGGFISYEMKISVNLKSRYELQDIIDIIFKKLKNIYKTNIKIIEDQIDIIKEPKL